MKRNVFEQVVALVNGQSVADMETLRNEVNAEWERMNAKRKANQDIYGMAKEVVFAVLAAAEKPMTVKEIFLACGDRLPEGFTAAKIQYAVLHYWNAEIEKHDNGKGAFTYSLR